MRDDNTPKDSEKPREESASEIPASLIFMELMRQAAARSQPATPPPPPEPVAPEPEIIPPHSDIPPASEGVAPPPVEAPAPTPSPAPIQPQPPQPTEEDRRNAAALEAQRVRRIKRRQQKRRQRTVSVLGGIIRSLMIVIPSAVIMATILSWWTDPSFLRAETRQDIQMALMNTEPTAAPTIVPTPNWLRRIGVVSGHRGPGQEQPYDPGAVCPDGLTENEINFNVATRVVFELRQRGYSAELLEEFDPRLDGYQAEAIISIHANDCSDYGEYVSGFLVSHAEARGTGGPDTILQECMATHYAAATGLERRFGLTRDMTDYHIFREIDPQTPGVIVELGFMLADRQILTERPDLLAQAIVNGILCFIEPDVSEPTLPEPASTDAPEPVITPIPGT